MKTKNKIKFASFIKIISLFLVPITTFGIYEFSQIAFLKLTRPSAFYCAIQLLSFFPALIFVLSANLSVKWQCKLFKAKDNVNKFIDAIFLLHIIFASSYAFFELRYSYFDFVFSKYSYQLIDVLLALFYIFLYLSNRFNVNKLFTIIFGLAYLFSEIFYYFYSDLEMNIFTIASIFMVSVYIIYSILFVNMKTVFYFKNYSNHLVLEDNDTFEKVNSYIVSAETNCCDIDVVLYCPDYNAYVRYNMSLEDVRIIDFYTMFDDMLERDYSLTFEALKHRTDKQMQERRYL